MQRVSFIFVFGALSVAAYGEASRIQIGFDWVESEAREILKAEHSKELSEKRAKNNKHFVELLRRFSIEYDL